MEQNEQNKSILVELDCLLDTRIATISQLNEEVAAGFVNNSSYLNRDQDNFEWLSGGFIDQRAFDTQYAFRNKDTLKLARPTPIIGLLNEISLEIEKQQSMTPFTESFHVGINIYPYELSDSEQQTLTNVISYYVGVEPTIEIVSLPYEDITPECLRDEWDALVIYDFNEWFCLHVNALNSVLIPRNVVYAPAFLLGSRAEIDRFIEEEGHNVNPFQLMEKSLVERLHLELLKVNQFSLAPLTA